MVTLENVLDLANQLTDEQQEMLLEIIKKRLDEVRRKQSIESATKFKVDGVKVMTAQKLITHLGSQDCRFFYVKDK